MVNQAVVGIIEEGDYIVLGKKKQIPGHFLSGKWHIPGGNVELCEIREAALKREMSEELGIKIKVGSYMGQSRSSTGNDMHWYMGKTRSFRLRAGDDLEDAVWCHKKYAIDFCGKSVTSLWPQSVLDYLSA